MRFPYGSILTPPPSEKHLLKKYKGLQEKAELGAEAVAAEKKKITALEAKAKASRAEGVAGLQKAGQALEKEDAMEAKAKGAKEGVREAALQEVAGLKAKGGVETAASVREIEAATEDESAVEEEKKTVGEGGLLLTSR